MPIYSSDVRSLEEKLATAMNDAAQKTARSNDKRTAAQDRANQLKVAELILIHGPEKVKAILETVSSNQEGIVITIPEKKVSPVPTMKNFSKKGD